MLGRFGQNIEPTKINGFLETHYCSLGLSSHDDVYSSETIDIDKNLNSSKGDENVGPPKLSLNKPKGRNIISIEQENGLNGLGNAKHIGRAARIMRNERAQMAALDLIPLVNSKLNRK